MSVAVEEPAQAVHTLHDTAESNVIAGVDSLELLAEEADTLSEKEVADQDVVPPAVEETVGANVHDDIAELDVHADVSSGSTHGAVQNKGVEEVSVEHEPAFTVERDTDHSEAQAVTETASIVDDASTTVIPSEQLSTDTIMSIPDHTLAAAPEAAEAVEQVFLVVETATEDLVSSEPSASEEPSESPLAEAEVAAQEHSGDSALVPVPNAAEDTPAVESTTTVVEDAPVSVQGTPVDVGEVAPEEAPVATEELAAAEEVSAVPEEPLEPEPEVTQALADGALFESAEDVPAVEETLVILEEPPVVEEAVEMADEVPIATAEPVISVEEAPISEEPTTVEAPVSEAEQPADSPLAVEETHVGAAAEPEAAAESVFVTEDSPSLPEVPVVESSETAALHTEQSLPVPTASDADVAIEATSLEETQASVVDEPIETREQPTIESEAVEAVESTPAAEVVTIKETPVMIEDFAETEVETMESTSEVLVVEEAVESGEPLTETAPAVEVAESVVPEEISEVIAEELEVAPVEDSVEVETPAVVEEAPVAEETALLEPAIAEEAVARVQEVVESTEEIVAPVEEVVAPVEEVVAPVEEVVAPVEVVTPVEEVVEPVEEVVAPVEEVVAQLEEVVEPVEVAAPVETEPAVVEESVEEHTQGTDVTEEPAVVDDEITEAPKEIDVEVPVAEESAAADPVVETVIEADTTPIVEETVPDLEAEELVPVANEDPVVAEDLVETPAEPVEDVATHEETPADNLVSGETVVTEESQAVETSVAEEILVTEETSLVETAPSTEEVAIVETSTVEAVAVEVAGAAEEAPVAIASEVELSSNEATGESVESFEATPAESFVVTTQEAPALVEILAPVEEAPAEVVVPVVSVDAAPEEPEASETVTSNISRSPSPSIQERPKSPWTPSYSVTSQGPGTTAEENSELAELEQLPPVAQEEVASTPLVEVTAEPANDATEGPSDAADPLAEPPKSPSWVPSYSVNSQGASPLHSPNVQAAELPEEAAPSAEPAVELVEEAVQPEQEPEAPAELVVEDVQAEPIEESEPIATSAEGPIVSDEVPAVEIPVIATEEVDAPEATEAPTPAPWVPSYSVSSQGSSPLHAPQETAKDADVAEVDSLPPPALDVEVPQEDSPAPVTEVETDTPAPAPEPEESASAVEPEANAEVEAEPNEALVVETATEAAPVIVTELAADKEPETPPTVPIGDERPKSPWTPSYSVTHQGNTPLASPVPVKKELEDLEQLPPPAEEKPSIVVEAIDVSPPEAPEASAVEQPPSRPWTPSYSVTKQGPGSDIGADEDAAAAVEKDAEAVMDTVHETATTNGNGHNTHSFPTSASEEPKKVTTRPSLGRLAVVDENEQIEIKEVSPAPGEISPSTARARHESTTSSRFFPGGWFSSTTKLPEEGRTSLDHATGEFSKTSSDSPAIEAPVNTPIDGDVDEKKEKKWCVIM